MRRAARRRSRCRAGSRSRCRPAPMLRLGACAGPGARAYLAVRGGIDVPEYLGSRSTFILGRFGGHAGRALRAGDMLQLADARRRSPCAGAAARRCVRATRTSGRSACSTARTARPTSSPTTTSRRSSRTDGRCTTTPTAPACASSARSRSGRARTAARRACIRRTSTTTPTPSARSTSPATCRSSSGPTARASAASSARPSIVARRAVEDRPASRPATRCASGLIIERAGRRAWSAQLDALDRARCAAPLPALPRARRDRRAAGAPRSDAGVVYRAAGDRYLLVEYGPNVLDLDLRFRVHALEQCAAASARCPASSTSRPGIRSLQVHYDSRVLPREALLDALDDCERALPRPRRHRRPDAHRASAAVVGRSRDAARDREVHAVGARRRAVVPEQHRVHPPHQRARLDRRRPATSSSTRAISCSASATSTSARRSRRRSIRGIGWSRRSTTRRAPGRRRTAVGIGGAYLCVYGMEGPGRLPVRRPHRADVEHLSHDARVRAGKPWLLRFFDQIRFFPVSADELLEMRDAFPHGKYSLDIEPDEFSLRDYHAVPARRSSRGDGVQAAQQAAFDAERERWAAAGPAGVRRAAGRRAARRARGDVPEGCEAVRSPMTASVWQVAVEPGQRVEAGQKLVVLEAMKMEVAIVAPAEGVVEQRALRQGRDGHAGQNLATLRVAADMMTHRGRCATTGSGATTPARCDRARSSTRIRADGRWRRSGSRSPTKRAALAPAREQSIRRCRSTAFRSRSRTTSTSPGMPTTAGCPAFAYHAGTHARPWSRGCSTPARS